MFFLWQCSVILYCESLFVRHVARYHFQTWVLQMQVSRVDHLLLSGYFSGGFHSQLARELVFSAARYVVLLDFAVWNLSSEVQTVRGQVGEGQIVYFQRFGLVCVGISALVLVYLQLPVAGSFSLVYCHCTVAFPTGFHFTLETYLVHSDGVLFIERIHNSRYDTQITFVVLRYVYLYIYIYIYIYIS